MHARRLHPWRVTPTEAAAIQERLAGRIREEPLRGPVALVAGADVSYEKHGDRFFAGVVVCRLPGLEAVESAWAAGRAAFPYVPGLLSFREGPVLLRAFQRLRTRPDVILFDGQGRAHPRRFGLACHLGLVLDCPSIGCAKSRLVGRHRQPGLRRGCRVRLVHRGEVVGLVVRTQDRVRPVYVSVGHRVDLASAASLVLATATSCRLPEPTRQAHGLVNRVRQAASGH